MKTRPLAVALLVALAPATFPVTVLAQSESEDPVTAMARARFKEGVEFYDKSQFEKARASFLQAYALKKHPAVLLNLAWSCLKSGHALDAERYFKQFLTDGKDITDKQRNDANDGLSQSRGKIGRIEVSAPAGTEVTVDGERAGSAPLGEPLAVEPGAHTVTFKGSDGSSDTQSVSVLGGEKATARFGRKSGAGAGGGEAPHGAEPSLPPTPTPTPPPAESTTPPEQAQPPAEEKPAKRATKTITRDVGGPGILTPPDNLLPVVIGGVLTAASAAVAIAMAVAKSQAADSQTSTAQQVNAAGLRCDPAGNPSQPNMAPSPALASACASYDNDVANQNADATIGNIALGVGIAAFVGTVVYWVVGDKSDPGSAGGAKGPSVTPLIGATPGGANLSLAGKF